jgi:FkbM family methyltransferase
LRRFQSIPGLGTLIKKTSWWLVPNYRPNLVRVQGGPGKGLLLRLNPRWNLPLWEGDYEKAVQQAIVALLGPNKTLYDVGGGIGFFSLIAARSGAQAICFEPDEANATFVETHAKLNSLSSQVHLVRKAVFSKTGSISLHPSRQDRGYGNAHISGIQVDRSAHWVTGENVKEVVPNGGRTIDVLSITLDEFVRTNPIPNLVKIDVEGAESDVLKGAEELFTKFKPHLICELHDSANSDFVQDWLCSKGYALSWLQTGDAFTRTVLASPAE